MGNNVIDERTFLLSQGNGEQLLKWEKDHAIRNAMRAASTAQTRATQLYEALSDLFPDGTTIHALLTMQCKTCDELAQYVGDVFKLIR